MKAWHFVAETLRDGSPIPADGEWLEHAGQLKLCASGLHASRDVFDALHHAPGSTICRVDVAGEIAHGHNKLVASRRKILWRVDGKQLLRRFARMCALDVVHLWEPPEVVMRYLKAGDESIRLAAGAAAWRCSDDRWGETASAAARAATWSASGDASEDDAGASAWGAASAATWAATGDNESDNERDAAWDAARKRQSKRLERMVRYAAFEGQGGEG